MLNATALYEPLIPKNEYYDKKSKLTPEEYKAQLKSTSTLYVGSPTLSRQHLEEYDRRSHLRAFQQVRRNQDDKAGP